MVAKVHLVAAEGEAYQAPRPSRSPVEGRLAPRGRMVLHANASTCPSMRRTLPL